MRKFYTKIKSNPEKDAVYTSILTELSKLDFKQQAGVALTATNLSKYELIKERLNLSHIYCIEDRLKTFNTMITNHIHYKGLFPIKTEIGKFLSTTTKAYNFGFIDLDFMTFWANILYPPNSKEVGIGYNMMNILPKLLSTVPRPFAITVTAQGNRRNVNNPLIRKVSTRDDFVELLPSNIILRAYNYNSGTYKMETILGIIK
jgi:hypothetical protein